jgi:hypothetical protein
MTRRQLLRQIAVLLGGAISPPVAAAALGDGQTISDATDWRPATLTPEQDRLVTVIAELIIPATDTPGATVAKVNRFVDLMLTDWYDDDDRKRFLAGLTSLDETSRETFGRAFLELAAEEQTAILEPLDRAGVAARIEAARDVGSFEVKNLPFFAMMKEMTLVGYYTSRVGVLEELGDEVFTGTYEACEPIPGIG